MKTYMIRVERVEYLHCYVDAESAEHALESYYDNDDELHWDDSDTKKVDVEEVK